MALGLFQSTDNKITPAAWENNKVSAINSTPSNPKQQKLYHQASILNKQFTLLRANHVSNPQAAQTLPLGNRTNILNSASSLLPQTSTKRKCPKSANY